VPAGVFAIQDIVDPAVAAMTAEQTGAFAITSITQRLV
jgi:thioredoxin reductase